MIIVSTKAFRARLSEFAVRAETETVYITRPNGRLLMLSSVPEKDMDQIFRVAGKVETELNDK